MVMTDLSRRRCPVARREGHCRLFRPRHLNDHAHQPDNKKISKRQGEILKKNLALLTITAATKYDIRAIGSDDALCLCCSLEGRWVGLLGQENHKLVLAELLDSCRYGERAIISLLFLS